MFRLTFFLILIYSTLLSSDFEDAMKKSQNEWQNYKNTQNNDFEAYQKEHDKAIKEFKNELSKIWQKPKLTTKNNLVSYTPDKKTRTDIDFKNDIITIQTIAKSDDEAKEKLKIALAKAVTIDTKTLFRQDQLQKKLSKIRKPIKMKTAPINAKPILAPVIFKKTPTKKVVKAYVDKQIKYKNIKVKKSKKLKHSKVYTAYIKMPSNTIIKRSKIYLNDAREQAIRQKIPLPLIFAIMHSESCFNPMARSYIPAFGLMQIVPKSAGIDAYFHLYNKKRLVSSSYLYNSKNNIKMGTAYLHILYYKYLRGIKNENAKLYCAIAAYNTGAGNIAWAFTKTYNISKAVKIINKMKPEDVYTHLLKHLKYDEPKHYLKKVTARMAIYYKLYGA